MSPVWRALLVHDLSMFDGGFDKGAALVGCTCELLRKVGERGAVQ